VQLTRRAADARLGHRQRPQDAFDDLKAAGPGTDGLAAIRKWVFSSADLAGFEPLHDGLRLAGIPN
jgi:hypothetical protein